MAQLKEYKRKYIFSWSIENFFSYFIENEERLFSPVFTVEPFRSSKWLLELFLENGGPMSDRFVSCYLRRIGDRDINIDSDTFKIEISYHTELMVSSCKLFSSAISRPEKFENGDWVVLIPSFCVKRNIVSNEMSSDDTMTIQLTMMSKNFNDSRDSECIARTIVGGHQCCFEWKLEQSFPQYKTFYCFYSVQIILMISSESDKIVRAVIRKTENDLFARFAQCKISFIDCDGTQLASRKSSGWFLQTMNEWIFDVPVANSVLGHLKSTINSIILLCECHFSNGALISDLRYVQNDAPLDCSITDLQDDFQRMYADKIFSDVKLIIKNEVFSAHKSVLCARSPVFLAMFSQSMVENQTNFVDVIDTDPKTFALFLKFLYTGDTDIIDCDSALKLLMCADKYQVVTLKEKCSYFLLTNMCEQNVCKILVVADMVGQKLLKSSAIRRITAHASNILKAADWKQLMENHAMIASEVLTQISLNFNR